MKSDVFVSPKVSVSAVNRFFGSVGEKTAKYTQSKYIRTADCFCA